MEKVKILLSQLLPLLKDNTLKTGDPLGIKTVYWTDWAKDFNLPRRGETIILTGRMYQMFPYITQATSLLASTERFLSRKVLGGIIRRGSKLVGEKAIVWGARKEEDLIAKSERTLCGIVKALLAIGLQPAYLYEDEPYSGALLYDLGLDEFLPGHINKVYRLLKERGAKEVIGVDPHTVLMLKEVYPRYISDYDLKVRHYLEVLAENENELRKKQKGKVEGNFVIHDSCVMARKLGFTEPQRRVLESLGGTVLEPENTKLDTLCCGGPIEYAFPDLTDKVSRNRMDELVKVSTDIAVPCPICLLNLGTFEQELGVKVSDVGELIGRAF